jgi:hypothetical protein
MPGEEASQVAPARPTEATETPVQGAVAATLRTYPAW